LEHNAAHAQLLQDKIINNNLAHRMQDQNRQEPQTIRKETEKRNDINNDIFI